MMEQSAKRFAGQLVGPCEDRRPAYTSAEIEKIAGVCHEANRAYCATLGDASQVPWAEAPEWQRESAMNGVRHCLGLDGHPPRFGHGASSNHDVWMEQKLREGWRYGPIKDVENKVHPCLLPYQSLPAEQKRKDVLFGFVVMAFDKSRSIY